MTMTAQIIEIVPALIIGGIVCASVIICCRSIMDDCRVKARVKKRR